ncbi:MAG TPA: hypothetical protein DDW23_04655 [Planctomycetes bacterium]|nr:hypothetical protein [Planctomycetota bacterium]
MTGASLGAGSKLLLALASFVVLIAGLQAAGEVIVPFLLAIVLAVALLPVLRRLQGAGVPRAIAVLLLVLSVALAIGLGAARLASAAGSFSEALPDVQARVESSLESMGIESPSLLLPPARAVEFAGRLAQETLGIAQQLLLVVLVMAFILLEAGAFKAKARLAFGEKADAIDRFQAGARKVQAYLGLKTVFSCLTGFLVICLASFFGLPHPILWGLLACLLNFVPVLGSLLAAVPPTLLALAEFGPEKAASVAVGFVVINFIVGNCLEPRAMGKGLGLSPLVVLLSLLFWGWIWGPAGMLLSVPMTVSVKLVLENFEGGRRIAVFLGGAVEPPPR